jgi:hypothetical protein
VVVGRVGGDEDDVICRHGTCRKLASRACARCVEGVVGDEQVDVHAPLQRRAEAPHEGAGAARRLAQATSTHASLRQRTQHAQARQQRRRIAWRRGLPSTSRGRSPDGSGAQTSNRVRCQSFRAGRGSGSLGAVVRS